MKIATRAGWIRVSILLSVLLVLCVLCYVVMIRMPGKSFAGQLPDPDERVRRYRHDLERDLRILAGDIGERNVFVKGSLQRALTFLRTELTNAGYTPALQEYQVMGETVANVEIEISGKAAPGEIVIIGAHYDSVSGTAGANDNGTGAVSVLALARAFAGAQPKRTLRFVLFVNEEPPFFLEETMGSFQYARRCRERKENITAMVSLETMGHYDDAKGSQQYPPPFSLFYPSTGNFIGFVGNLGSRAQVRRMITVFRNTARFPSEGIATFSWLPGIFWSDHWSFWKHDYPGVMVTDTAPFRYPHYHKETDVPDRVDYDRLARVVAGLESVIKDLAGL